ncbi:hypothetical protein ACPYOC_01240 [Ornithinimicrobium sp. W1665]|uniref:hypothetical protein n=1 Tax=Ornithinimicrobium sp. W1665 TaxID=3416666 RepID=UPI003CF32A9E
MSDSHTSDRDVLALLDRAAVHSPPLHLARTDVVRRGEQIVRRRRAGGAGLTIGTLALAGALWLGTGGAGGGLSGTREVTPAGVAWEVEEASPVVLPEGLQGVGNVQPLTLGRTADSSSATFVADGVEETVEGRSLAGGVEVYAGTGATVVVWARPPGVSGELVLPDPQDAGGSAVVTVAGEELVYWTTDRPGYAPAHLVLHDDDDMWTAGGAVADTAELADDGVVLTAVSLEEAGLAGYLDRGSFSEVDTLTVAGLDRPWWRGGGDVVASVARLPREAVFAREVLRQEVGADPVRVSPPRATALVGPWSMVLFADDRADGDASEDDLSYDIEWSTDGETWHPRPSAPTVPTAPAEASAGTDGAVPPGGEVTLLGETYRVATDQHGWPRLVDVEGQDLLTVSDESGPSDGGAVLWREHWWPWSARNQVHFAVGPQPPAVPGDGAGPVVRISGPAGMVSVVAVPAGS